MFTLLYHALFKYTVIWSQIICSVGTHLSDNNKTEEDWILKDLNTCKDFHGKNILLKLYWSMQFCKHILNPLLMFRIPEIIILPLMFVQNIILIHSIKRTGSFLYVSFDFGVLQEHYKPQSSKFSHILNDSYLYHFQTTDPQSL